MAFLAALGRQTDTERFVKRNYIYIYIYIYIYERERTCMKRSKGKGEREREGKRESTDKKK